jgi:hypothetical protein
MTATFWRAVTERALKSAAQAVVLVVGASQFDWLNANWSSIGVSALAAAALSVLTSIASIPYGANGTPSMIGLLASTKTVTPPVDAAGIVPVDITGDAAS